MEATILAIENVMAKKNKPISQDILCSSPLVYIISVGEETKKQSFYLLNLIRKSNLSADFDYEGRSIKAQMRTANKVGAKYVIVLGPDESARGDVKIKIMETSEEVTIKQSDVLTWLLGRHTPSKC